MGKIVFLLVLVVLFSSIISADIIFTKQPSEIYNLGDTIQIPTTIKATSDISGSFDMDLLCDNGQDINFYKNGINLHYGEEEKFSPSLVLTRDIIRETTGTCKIKASLLNEEPQITNGFKISNLITIQAKTENAEFRPGEGIIIEGTAIKEDGKDANGFLEIKIISPDTEETDSLGTIGNGLFSENLSLEKNAKAGEYKIQLHAYERNFLGETTNEGSLEYSVSVVQVPTNLEIVFENEKVKPGTSLSLKTVLHDQTGQNIDGSLTTIKITNENGLVVEQAEKKSGETFEFPIPYNELPSIWNVSAKSGKLTNEAGFEILENKKVKTEIINRTLIITNVGNVPYNDTVLVKIGNQSLNVDTNLGVDENKKYTLNAPDGEYAIEVLANGETQLSENVMLTGRSIDIKEAREGVISIVRHPLVWVFIIGILGFVSFIIFKKGYKRSFFGYIYSRKKQTPKGKEIPLRKRSLITTANRADLSLSLKGEKQNISLVCLKIKNLKEIESKKTNAEEGLQQVVNLAEEKKAAVYENQDNIFFLLAPVKTKTFKNEKTAIELAQKIKDVLAHHNRLYKQKIQFGISLNYGSIVAKQETDSLKFMSMGTLITSAKKIASISEEEILLSEKIKEKLIVSVKTEKQTKGEVTYYTIKEIKDSDQHKKFISSFLERIEKK